MIFLISKKSKKEAIMSKTATAKKNISFEYMASPILKIVATKRKIKITQ